MKAHTHASARRVPAAAPPASLLGLGVGLRLAFAAVAVAGVWGAIAWAASA
ncbi:hypothetical protein [Methylobacterium sp. ID0610]|uniref:hypothetical protein n=1 Tax=Methylobacterium carpenticola TaxID=3344827 RepID=UPI00368CF6DB